MPAEVLRGPNHLYYMIPFAFGAILITLLVGVFIIRKSKHPVVVLLECFGFVFLYASIYENFAVVQGWYIYGRSFLMVGDVPLSVPLLEMDVLVTGLWLLEKMEIRKPQPMLHMTMPVQLEQNL